MSLFIIIIKNNTFFGTRIYSEILKNETMRISVLLDYTIEI